MKKQNRMLCLVLALALCLSLGVPALAFNTGKAGEYNIISAGRAHTAAVDENGALWVWGDNQYGQLGNGTTDDSLVPIKAMDNVATVSCGQYYTAAIKTDGSLWMWGDARNGALGNGLQGNVTVTIDNGMGKAVIQTVPVKVMDNVAAVSCGEDVTAAIKTDGTLWTWGNCDYGQLGNGGEGDYHVYLSVYQTVPIKVMDNVATVSFGYNHTATIKTDGSLWMWGTGRLGQLGNGEDRPSLDPFKLMDDVAFVCCGIDFTAAIKTDGSLWVWGSGHFGNGTTGKSLLPIKVMDNVATVGCGYSFTAAIKTDGSLWTWGEQLGGGKTASISKKAVKVMDDVAAVSCGGKHMVAVKTDGTLWTWGNNNHGEVGNGGTGNETIPIQITLGGASMPRGVRLHLNGGIGGGTLWTSPDGSITVPTNPTRPGYTFGGWYTDAALTIPWNFNDAVVGTLVLYAKWVPVSSTAATTNKSAQTISLNGNAVTLDAYNLVADNGGDVTYVKLRDIAALLEGTGAKFNVDWRNRAIYVSTGAAYTTKNGTELKPISGTDGSYQWNTASVLFDGTTKALEGIVLTDGAGGGHTFFKLRDLGEAVGFTVGWTAERGIYIETA